MGASLLAKASAHPASSLPDPPLSRAGSLHRNMCQPPNPRPTTNPCGSGLAREGVGTSDIYAD
ncbi:hypothetical protein C0J26_24995 [Pseudomonas baetica]|nr:hypothetical protein C0J26_24995 [Pseudomonas baetica]